MALTQEDLDKLSNNPPSQPGNPFVDGDSGDPLAFRFHDKDDGFDWKTDGMLLNEKWAKKNPDDAQGKLIKLQWEDFLNRYAPLEKDLLNRIQDFDFTEEARDAGNTVGQSFDQQISGLDRNMSRFGLRPSETQSSASEDVLQRQKALSMAGAENLTRRNMRDRNLQLMGIMAGQGKGIAQSSLQGMGQAGNMAAQRKQVGDQAKDQQTQGMVGGAMGGAMLGSSLGVPGMVVGAIAGGLLGGI